MQLKQLTWSLAVAGCVSFGLSGCGGGSSSAVPAATPITLTGTAATGAAFTGGTVYVYDSSGSIVGSTNTIDSSTGQYTLTLNSGATAPFVLVASRTTSDGQTETLVSVVGSTDQTTANITPITSLIAARLSPTGDPTQLATQLASGSSITPTAVSQAITDIQTVLQPLLSATGTTSIDPINGTFTVDGTGYDKLLDSLSINIVPTGSTSNVEITVKQQVADGSTPTAITFASDTSAPPALPTIDPATLLPDGTSVLIANFLAQLNSCYALPTTSRVSGTTAADVAAVACKSAFWNSDPTTYRHNGKEVGQNKAFNSLYQDAGTGLVFSQGSYEFTRGNGDLVIGYKSRDVSGNETFDSLVVRKDTSDNKLKLIGNQYAFPGGVSAYHQLRQFPTLGQSANNYYSSGYTLNVANTGTLSKVVVTTPLGGTINLVPAQGSSNLNIQGFNNTNYVRLARAFADTGNTNDPAGTSEGTRLFFTPTRYSDSQMEQLGAHSVWKFEYYLTGNGTQTPDATQYYTTRARALSIAELRHQGLAQLTQAVVADIAASVNQTTGAYVFTAGETVDFSGTNNTDVWTVATGQLPPTQLKLFGKHNNVAFDDAASVRSTARKGVITCAQQSPQDRHCEGGGAGPGYETNAIGTGIHLWARDRNGREFVNFYAMYKLQ